ncbi:hypothetical protein Pcinc_021992 [Petrolisthes cinctipes]|uniref:Uncharacterized protein n=1 Tax=Petrolisthes cinctipes TaxID=88211 RepID=A0AAE1FEJ4_PETCI|nr:hypothetical protein Pcinc_021992 [Petrolisthes cinctipes]
MTVRRRVACEILFLLLVVGDTLASTLNPMDILRAQMAYIKANDHMSTTTKKYHEITRNPSNTPQAIRNTPTPPPTPLKFDLSALLSTEHIPTHSSPAYNSPTTTNISPTGSQNVLRTTGSTTKQPSMYNRLEITTQGTRGPARSSVLGSLFELGINEVEESEPGVEQTAAQLKPAADHKAAMSSLTKLLRELGNMTVLPLVTQEGHQSLANFTGNNSSLSHYLDAVRGNAWGQFKGLALSYTNWMEKEYKMQPLTEKLPLDFIKKVLDLGDRVNFLHVVGKKVDPGLAKFLADQLQPLFSHFETLTAGKLVGGRLSSAVGGIVRDAAWKSMHQFVNHVLKVADNFVTKEELEHFKKDLAKTSPLAAQGLDLILNGPPEAPPTPGGRSLYARSGYRDGGHGGGYGGYGAYDESYGSYGTQGYSSGGYAAGLLLDPYLILAGLGAAVLLAYLAYRVIVTTEAAAARSYNDLTFMDLSDIPGVVHSLYSMLEDAEDKYREKRSVSGAQDDADDLIQAVNSLWYEHEDEIGCVRCSLFQYANDHVFTSMRTGHNIALAGLAQILGSPGSGQLFDQVAGRVLEGQAVSCHRRDNTCDLH